MYRPKKRVAIVIISNASFRASGMFCEWAALVNTVHTKVIDKKRFLIVPTLQCNWAVTLEKPLVSSKSSFVVRQVTRVVRGES